MNMTIGVAPLADIPPKHESLVGVWVFRLAGLVGLASGIQFCGETRDGSSFHLSKSHQRVLDLPRQNDLYRHRVIRFSLFISLISAQYRVFLEFQPSA